MTKVKFRVLELCDPPKQKSEMAVGNVYIGEFEQAKYLPKGKVTYTDKAEADWIFYVGDTCEIVDINPQ